jgi:RNA polymerase sigma-70 factor (ECF subfamily)
MGRTLQIVSEDVNGAQGLVASARDSGPDPERRARATELLERVEEALGRLPEHYRVVVWLRDGEDLSYQEIADALDVPIGTVRSRLARARGALKEMVES